MIEYQHKELAAGGWAEMSLAEQMLNIGSEVSCANRWKRSIIIRVVAIMSSPLFVKK